MAEREHRRTSDIANTARGAGVSRSIVRIETERTHQRVGVRSIGWKEIDLGSICGIADRLELVRVGSFADRTSRDSASLGGHRLAVVSGPSVIHAGINNREHAGDDRRAWMRIADILQRHVVPLNDYRIGSGGGARSD